MLYLLQSSTTELVSHKCEMVSLQRRIKLFAAKNPDVLMTQFAEDVTETLDVISDNLKQCVNILNGYENSVRSIF